jgi:lysine 2,3-aminomutase
MLLPPKQLDYIFSEVLTHTHIREFRLHTKAIVFNPNCITPSHQEVLKKYDVRTVFHIVHPYEICSEVSKKIEELRSRKIRLYNHFPILRNINDHVDVLIENIKAVDALGIHNLSIYFPDPVQHSSTYRIRFSRLFEMVKSFHQNTPSWINATRFCQDTVHGKVRPEDLVEYREEENIAIFQRGKQRITVPDHPIELDLAGDPNIMLWKKPLANPS